MWRHSAGGLSSDEPNAINIILVRAQLPHFAATTAAAAAIVFDSEKKDNVVNKTLQWLGKLLYFRLKRPTGNGIPTDKARKWNF